MRSNPAPDARVPLMPPQQLRLFQMMANSAVTSFGAEPFQVHHVNYGAMLQCIATWLDDQGHSDAAELIRQEAEHAAYGP